MHMFQLAKRKIQTFLIEESGPTAVEYAVMLALIMAVAIVGIGAMGLATRDMWQGNTNSINNAVNASAGTN